MVRDGSQYDHRLRELVRTTQDVSYAVQRGVPRSTARGWLNAPHVEVMTLDSLNMDATQSPPTVEVMVIVTAGQKPLQSQPIRLL